MRPTHRLKVLNKATGATADLGAGWLNANQSISIRINECVCMQNDPNMVYTLFPANNSVMNKLVREANAKGPIGDEPHPDIDDNPTDEEYRYNDNPKG